MIPEHRVEAFFAYARERHSIYLKRLAGDPWPWTSDPILQQYRFTNVFRELDKTTQWFKKNVREPLRNDPSVFLATVIFRWFNTIRTGETIFCQPDVLTGRTPFEDYVVIEDLRALRPWLRQQGPPWVTGSYMIKSKDGMDKLDGVLYYVQQFVKSDWKTRAEEIIDDPGGYTLEGMWEGLCCQEGLGPFLAYEIVTDLRHTAMLDNAPDIMTWANPGPGAKRGITRLLDEHTERRVTPTGKLRVIKADTETCMRGMRFLLKASSNHAYWPVEYPKWEMRDVEHTLCEFDKYSRVQKGHGRPRQVFRGAV
jgi:hypothetical protein